MTTRTLLVVGSGGHAAVVGEIAVLNGWIPIFFDANKDKVGDPDPLNRSTIRAETDLSDWHEDFIVAVGDNSVRQQLHKRLMDDGYAPVSALVHPQATVSAYAQLGVGSVVMAGAIVNPRATVGDGCIINTGVIIEHDCCLGDFVHISPSATLCGAVELGNCSWVGAGTTVIQCKKIGEGCTIGANSTVIKDIEANSLVVGTPARLLE